MRALSFGDMTIRNFKSYSGKHVLPLGNLDSGLHMLAGRNRLSKRMGSNGAGKSSLWDAFCWCLTGRTTKGLRNPDVRPWQASGRTSVRLRIGDHVIKRFIGPNLLTLDGREVGQADIEAVTGLSYSLLTNTILLGQGRPLFFDLEPRRKLEIFSEALALDRWDYRAKAASERVADLETDIASIEGMIGGANDAIKELDSMIADQRRKEAEYDHRMNSIERETRKRIEALERELESVALSYTDADLALDAAEIEARHIECTDIPKLEKAFRKAQRKLDRELDALALLDGQARAFRKELRGLAAGDECPSCGQSLRGEHLDARREKLKSEIRSLEKWIEAGAPLAVSKAYSKAQRDFKNANAQLVLYRRKANDAADKLDSAAKRQAELKAELKAARRANADRENADNPHTAEIISLKARRKKLYAKIDAMKEKADKAKSKRIRSRFWVKGFRDVRLYVLEDVLDQLEFIANGMLDGAGLVGWEITFDIEKESKTGNVTRGLNVLIKSPSSGGPVRWESWSGGEGQRLRVVGALALSECLLSHAGIRPDLEILDEPTAHLSEEGVSDLCNYLADRAHSLDRRIMYADQQSVESGKFSSVITIYRGKDGSHIQWA